MKALYFSLLIFLSLTEISIASTKKLAIEVALSPAGSFTITSLKIKGKVYLDGEGNLSAQNIKVPVKSLKTGIELRDTHLQNKLGLENDKKAALLLIEASGSKGAGKAKFQVLNKTQTVDFNYKKVSEALGEATFSLSLDTFGISGISYMGVGVKDIVKVKVNLPLKMKK